MLVDHVRCSKLDRVMKCPGFINLKDLVETDGGAPAAEGTAAGELLAQMLLQGTPTPKVNTHATNGVRFDEDMYFYLTPIAGEILAKAQSPILCEQRIDWQIPRLNFLIKGSFDISYIRDGKLYIDDLKYGWKIVEVKENWQLIGYAIGEYLRRSATGEPAQVAFDEVVLRIHQPRPHHEDGTTREWKISLGDLMIYRQQITEHIWAINAASKTELITGPQCKYCPAAAKDCPAINRAMFSAIDYVLSDPKQDNLDGKQIAHHMKILERVEEIFKIKKDSMKQLAISKISSGGVIPGYGVEPSYGDRKWKEGVSPDIIEKFTGKSILKKEMLSPAQAEKLGINKDLVASLTDRYFKGTNLVRKDTENEGDKIFGNPNK